MFPYNQPSEIFKTTSCNSDTFLIYWRLQECLHYLKKPMFMVKCGVSKPLFKKYWSCSMYQSHHVYQCCYKDRLTNKDLWIVWWLMERRDHFMCFRVSRMAGSFLTSNIFPNLCIAVTKSILVLSFLKQWPSFWAVFSIPWCYPTMCWHSFKTRSRNVRFCWLWVTYACK